jgi:hypothetical protein
VFVPALPGVVAPVPVADSRPETIDTDAIAAGIAGLTREHDPRRVGAGIAAADTEKMDGSRTPMQMATHGTGHGREALG